MRMSYEWPLEDDVTKDLRKKPRAPSIMPSEFRSSSSSSMISKRRIIRLHAQYRLAPNRLINQPTI